MLYNYVLFDKQIQLNSDLKTIVETTRQNKHQS